MSEIWGIFGLIRKEPFNNIFPLLESGQAGAVVASAFLYGNPTIYCEQKFFSVLHGRCIFLNLTIHYICVLEYYKDLSSMSKAVIYARVSSMGDRQSTERQVADLTRYAKANNLTVVKVFEDKASGVRVDREGLEACLEFLKGGGAQHLLVSELSRLGRTLLQVLQVVNKLTEAGVNIYFQDHRMNTLKDDGLPDPVVKMLISMIGTFAEMEREQISYRLNSGRRLAMANGVKMGRKVGYRLSDEELLAKYPKVLRKLREGFSLRDTAKICEVSVSTVQKVDKVRKNLKK